MARKIVKVTTKQHLKFGTEQLRNQFGPLITPGAEFTVEPPWLIITWRGESKGVPPADCVVDFAPEVADAAVEAPKRGGRPPKAAQAPDA